MKKTLFLLLSLFVLGCAHSPCKKDVVFQNAPINALMAGCYTGTMSIHDLKKHGDFGIGTLDALDGEMIALGGLFYQIKPDGEVRLLDGKAMSPFATVTFFHAKQEWLPEGVMNYQELTRFLDGKLVSRNLLYSFKIEGRFSTIKVRSAARQNHPYRVLTEAIKEQKVFELKDQEGTLVGFRVPAYMEGVNVPGYHFHFLSKDKKRGGHVLDFSVEGTRIEMDESRRFSMTLPESEEFLRSELKASASGAIAKVEK